MIGHAFMGAAHSHAWRNVARAFKIDLVPEMAVLCGRDAARSEAAARRYGWAESASDWRAVVERDDIDVIDVCAPTDTHLAIATAALDAGKHVLCEKPLGRTVAEGEAMALAAQRASRAGVRSMVGFNYRRVPAVALARRFILDGLLGEVRHVRGTYLQDWLVDPMTPMSWRLERERAGSGALGDIGSHVVDAAMHLTGDRLVGVSALTATFIGERPLADEGGGGFLGGVAGGGRAAVSVDDAAVFIARFQNGALATFEVTRAAAGRKNALGIEINGTAGSISFDFEAMNELMVFDCREGERAGFRRILATEASHPYLSGWWPPGHGLGYDHTFVNELVDFLEAIAAGIDPSPSFAEGLEVQRVLAAVEQSASHASTWTAISPRQR